MGQKNRGKMAEFCTILGWVDQYVMNPLPEAGVLHREVGAWKSTARTDQ